MDTERHNNIFSIMHDNLERELEDFSISYTSFKRQNQMFIPNSPLYLYDASESKLMDKLLRNNYSWICNLKSIIEKHYLGIDTLGNEVNNSSDKIVPYNRNTDLEDFLHLLCGRCSSLIHKKITSSHEMKTCSETTSGIYSSEKTLDSPSFLLVSEKNIEMERQGSNFPINAKNNDGNYIINLKDNENESHMKTRDYSLIKETISMMESEKDSETNTKEEANFPDTVNLNDEKQQTFEKNGVFDFKHYKCDITHHYSSCGLQTDIEVLNQDSFQQTGFDYFPSETDPKIVHASGMDWKDYHNLKTIEDFLDDMEYQYPSICTTGVIGHSLENRIMKVIKISNSNSTNSPVWLDAGIHAREWIAPAVATYVINKLTSKFNGLPKYMTNKDCPVWLDAGIHAREWIAPAVATYVINKLTSKFNGLPKYMTNKDWYILPVMNPDGYEYTHTTNRLWRKNKAYHCQQCVGVDLNRNFSIGWGERGSSPNPNAAFYRGPKPFSEPESCNVRDMLSQNGIKFKVYVTLHCYGQIIMFPYSYKTELCPDYIRLLEGATQMSKAIYATTGNIYKVGISRDVMYGAAGTSMDWSYSKAKIPFCYLLELRSKRKDKSMFSLPEEQIEETGEEIFSALKALMEYVDTWSWERLETPQLVNKNSVPNPYFLEGTNTMSNISV